MQVTTRLLNSKLSKSSDICLVTFFGNVRKRSE